MSKKPWICCACRSMRQDAVRAAGHEQIGDQLGRDRHAGLVLAVLPGVAVKGHDRGDPLRAGPPRRVDHDEQLHQVLVGRRRGRLDDVDVAAADILVDLDEGLAVGKRGDRRLAERHADVFGDFLGEGGVGVAGENLRAGIVHGQSFPRCAGRGKLEVLRSCGGRFLAVAARAASENCLFPQPRVALRMASGPAQKRPWFSPLRLAQRLAIYLVTAYVVLGGYLYFNQNSLEYPRVVTGCVMPIDQALKEAKAAGLVLGITRDRAESRSKATSRSISIGPRSGAPSSFSMATAPGPPSEPPT